MIKSLDEVARLWVQEGGGVLAVSGRSMRPTFEDNARVWIETVDDTDRRDRIRFGDILVYTNGSFLVVHRVVALRAGAVVPRAGARAPAVDAAEDVSAARREAPGPFPARGMAEGRDTAKAGISPAPETHYRTKGDGLPHVDPALVPASRVWGRVIAIERGGRRFMTDGTSGRSYARLAGACSAVEGFLYRVAYRLDRLAGRVLRPRGSKSGPVVLRRAVRASGRAGLWLLDAALFARLNRKPSAPGAAS